MRMKLLGCACAVLLLVSGCGNGNGNGNGVGDGVGESERDGQGDTARDTQRDVDREADGEAPFVPEGPEGRGWLVLRGVVHMHSALSHDGCAPDGYEDNEGPEPGCLDELRAAPCQSGMDFLMLTDHPGHARDHTFEEGLQYRADAGDELILDSLDRPFANRIACPDGSAVDRAWVFAGTEGHKNMPVGLAGPVPDAVYDADYGDEGPLDKAQAAIDLVHDMGGFAFAAHTEEDNISVERMLALPLDGMEIYNIHANLMESLESLDSIFALESFLEGTQGGPEPDLGILLFLSEVTRDVEKLDEILGQMHIATVAATDIHRNVEIPALCPGGVEGSLCETLAQDYPNFAQFAVNGGAVPMSDGDRMDSYARSFRWLSNRALVAADDPALIREAVGRGRTFATFDLFGIPAGFDFYIQAGDTTYEMGDEAALTKGMTIHFNSPLLQPGPWAEDWPVDWSQAELSCALVQVTNEGSIDLVTIDGQAGQVNLDLPGPGAYRVACSVRPHHLLPVLPGAEHLAAPEYPYLYSNAIRVTSNE